MRVALNIEPNHLIEHLQSLANRSAKVSADSRQIESGDIFFAYPVGHGNALRDGRQYIDAAIQNGHVCWRSHSRRSFAAGSSVLARRLI